MKRSVFLTLVIAGLYGPVSHANEPAAGEIISRPLIEYRQAPPRERLPESVVPRRYYRGATAPAAVPTGPADTGSIPAAASLPPPPAPEAPREQRIIPAEQYDHITPVIR
jgi:hypothetical protein